ncbi:MAG: hypothetical protein K2G49_10025 [Muribaculum sp.]|nr:hypothetical protein [Muribaculum sp.]
MRSAGVPYSLLIGLPLCSAADGIDSIVAASLTTDYAVPLRFSQFRIE